MLCRWSSGRGEESGLEGAAGGGKAGYRRAGRLGLRRGLRPRATRSRPGGSAATQGRRGTGARLQIRV